MRSCLGVLVDRCAARSPRPSAQRHRSTTPIAMPSSARAS